MQVIRQRDLYFVDKMTLGNDYSAFYHAGWRMSNGFDPYLTPAFITPPMSAIVNEPFTLLSFHLAAEIVAALIFLSLAISLYLMHRILGPPGGPTELSYIIDSVLIIMFSFPCLLLIDRGNIDAFVLLLLCIALYNLDGHAVSAGVLFALAISLKAYPIIILLPLVALKRWKVVLVTCVTIVAIFLVSPLYWVEWLKLIMPRRITFFTVGGENASIFSTLYLIGSALDVFKLGARVHEFSDMLRGASLYISSFLLGIMVLTDAMKKNVTREEMVARIAMYMPFMVALPKLSIQYQLVLVLPMIPVLSWCWKKSVRTFDMILVLVVTLGVVASQFQVVAFTKLTGSSTPGYIPGLGLLVVLVGVTIYKLNQHIVDRRMNRYAILH